MIDLLYFGTRDEGGPKDESTFKKQIKEKFPDVTFENAYDDIKGYRQQVIFPDNLLDDYLSWLVGKGWYQNSLHFQIMMINDRKKVSAIFDLAKKQYPGSFKTELRLVK